MAGPEALLPAGGGDHAPAALGKQHALHVLNAFRVDEYGSGEVV